MIAPQGDPATAAAVQLLACGQCRRGVHDLRRVAEQHHPVRLDHGVHSKDRSAHPLAEAAMVGVGDDRRAFHVIPHRTAGATTFEDAHHGRTPSGAAGPVSARVASAVEPVGAATSGTPRYRSTTSTTMRRCAAARSGAIGSFPKMAPRVWRFDTRWKQNSADQGVEVERVDAGAEHALLLPAPKQCGDHADHRRVASTDGGRGRDGPRRSMFSPLTRRTNSGCACVIVEGRLHQTAASPRPAAARRGGARPRRRASRHRPAPAPRRRARPCRRNSSRSSASWRGCGRRCRPPGLPA